MIFSIIIPTCNRNNSLEKCLDALHPDLQHFPIANYEVIVTDDSPTNIAKELITNKYKWVEWIAGPKKGPAANRNNGAKMATADWLIFLDDDVIPSSMIINNYLKALLGDTKILVLEGKVLPDREQQNQVEESPINEYGGKLWSCNFAIKRKLFFELKGFDENFPFAAMEDVDLHLRLINKGIIIKFVDNALVIHPWRQPKNIIEISNKRFLSTLYFLKKHPTSTNEINPKYFLKAGLHRIKDAITNGHKFQYKGTYSKLIDGLLQFKYASVLFFRKK